MRRIMRRPELVPEGGSETYKDTSTSSDDDKLFLRLLKRRHLHEKYGYMREWWEKHQKEAP